MGKEIILITLDKHHSLTTGKRAHRISEDPISFVDSLEELVGSGSAIIKKSMARQMLWNIGTT